MSEQLTPEATLAVPNTKSLELLFDYTKTHIRIYVALTAAYATLAAATFGKEKIVFLFLDPSSVKLAIGGFVVAGIAGGTVASSITQTDATTSREFLRRKIGPCGTRLLAARYWTWIEHLSFWWGVGCALLSFSKLGG